jgi:hypothetical protein
VSVTLVIQHAKRMRPILLSSVACVDAQYISTLPHKLEDFRKKNTQNMFCFSLQLCVKYFSFQEELNEILS